MKKLFINKKEFFFLIVLLIITAAFLFSEVNNQHNVGDDFALYLKQSKNVFDGKPQTNNFFIYNEDYPQYSPKTYAVGFPIILSPIWMFESNKILGAKCIMIMGFCALLGIFFFAARRNQASIISSSILTVLLGIIFYLFNLERYILADTFLILCVVAIWLIDLESESLARSKKGLLVFILVASYLIKPIGITALISYLIFSIYQKIKFAKRKEIVDLLPIVLLFYALVFIINFLTKQKGNDFSRVIAIILSQNYLEVLSTNLIIYKNEILAMIGTLGTEKMRIFAKFSSCLILMMFCVGFVEDIWNKLKWVHLFIITYLAIILVFPNYNQGPRYLLPMLPFYFYYAIVPWIEKEWVNKESVMVFYVLAILLAVSSIEKKKSKYDDDAFSDNFVNAYNSIVRNAKSSENVLCAKPRLVGFMTNRACGTVDPKGQITKSIQFVERAKINFILKIEEMPNEAIDHYIENQESKLTIIDSASGFILYRKKLD